MKLYKSILSMALLVVAMVFTSCNEDGYWDPYTEDGTKYSFAQSSSSFSYLASDAVSQLEIQVFRSTTKGASTVPVVFESSADILSGAESVFFADGSNVGTYVVTINGEITIGATYNANLTIAEEVVSPSGNAVCAVSLIKDYTWESAGSCVMTSYWAGVRAKINIQKAAEYEGNLYRLVSPYYYLEPSYCPNPGYHLQFELDANNQPLGMPRFQNIGEKSSKGGNWNLFWDANGAYGSSFTRDGDVFTIKGVWCYGDASMGYSLYDYATEIFQWTEGCPQ